MKKIIIDDAGKVGIGLIPNRIFEVKCPSGFTSIEAGDNQLGCMQNTEEGSGTWETADDVCFDAYGERLPTTGEGYITMANYALTDETDDYEWVSDCTGINAHACMGGGDIPSITSNADGGTYAYRCWIPR